MTGRPVSPCKRPKTELVEWVPNPDLRVARCLVPACEWECGPSVKTHVAEQATQHRMAHRAGVPKVLILGNAFEGWRGQCFDCGPAGSSGTIVVRGPELRTYGDCRAALDGHLVDVHGLVVSP